MKNTAHKSCRMIASLLVKHGVTKAVLSPGSRNAPLIVALSRTQGIDTQVVVDERCAAFVALGMAVQTGTPVAIACTSGTAVLNYAPAVAEAYYRGIPLIVLTADRPAERIDVLDSQTMRQVGVYENYIKGAFSLPSYGTPHMSRVVNEALILAMAGRPGPVHINVPLDPPLGAIEDCVPEDYSYIDYVGPSRACPPTAFTPSDVDGRNIMLVVGFMAPDKDLLRVLDNLNGSGRVVIVHECQSNIYGLGGTVGNPEAVFGAMAHAGAPGPDLLVTIGGSVTSGCLKRYLQQADALEHWSIGQGMRPADTYGCISRVIDCEPVSVIDMMARMLGDSPASEYKRRMLDMSAQAYRAAADFAAAHPESAMNAVRLVLSEIADGSVLHLGNGMAVRYAQLYGCPPAVRVDCNRGVSGIDGCTSTAVGAAMVSGMPTVLLSGDMSAQYDMGALALAGIPAGFKMVVLANGGGAIFRHISSTADLDELERCFVGSVRVPLEDIARGCGFGYFRARSVSEVPSLMRELMSCGVPAILEIVTDGVYDARCYRDFTEFVKNI